MIPAIATTASTAAESSDGIGGFWGVVAALVVAIVAHAVTSHLDRAAARRDERRVRYAEAVSTLVAWAEFPYRVRRRTSDTPETLAALASIGHDLQEKLACHEAWIAADDPTIAIAYLEAKRALAPVVGEALESAWSSSPISNAAGMVLGDWGPGPTIQETLDPLETAIREGTKSIWRW